MALLTIIIINRDIERNFTKEILDEKFIFTRLGSTGGFLRKKSATLLIGLKDEKRLNLLKNILEKIARKRSSYISADSGRTLSSETGLPDLPLGAAPLIIGGATLFVIETKELVRY